MLYVLKISQHVLGLHLNPIQSNKSVNFIGWQMTITSFLVSITYKSDSISFIHV